jgi:hypothetical protein
MPTKILNSIAEKWIKSFQEHDIEGLVALYDKGAKHYSPRVEKERPETKGWLVGEEQLRKWWWDTFKRLPSLTYQLVDLTVADGKIFMKYIRKVTEQPDLEVMEYLRVENGLVVESRVLGSWAID